MEFSIIIPTFQEEGFIEECLRSIVNQHYNKAEYEIIVSDAHSTDRTVDIARKYTNNVIVEDKRGIAYGRNSGSHTGRGDIFVFVDSDATLSTEFLKNCHLIFENPAIVGMTGIAKPSDGKIMPRLIYRGTYGLVRLFHLFGLSLFPGICVAYRRDAFNKIGGFREDFGIVEDLDLSKRISRLGICAINSKAFAYVSTRRLERNMLSTVLFHIYCDIKYLFTGKAPAVYPKSDEINSSAALWNSVNHKT